MFHDKNYILTRLKALVIFIFITGTLASAQQTYEFPYQNPDLSFEVRVNDLIGRMTLDEKISQMMNAAPATPRLGIPEYNWWNECLHGVARSGLATVFPQAIGLGAIWDENFMFKVSTAISDEARAKHQEYERQGKRLIYQGLTFWSPNINIFRDPRWGRGQETYGEDPFLTGRMGVQFIKGLQGDDPKYFKVIATVKHFAVHSGPEPERHSFNAITDERDLRETYLPQFEMGIKEGKAYSVMCAYNRYMGLACCSSDQLLTNILRNEWGFQGYIVSDCGAIADIYRTHKIVPAPQEAAALAVKSGTDLECSTVYQNLRRAVNDNLISEKEIDVSVKRLFMARFRLGMFDPPEMVKYAQIPYTVVDSRENKELALEAARKSIVLLKNKNNLLPLNKNLRKVAVIGPNSDDPVMLLGNYNGIPSDPVTPLRGIRKKLAGHSTVLYARGSEIADSIPSFYTIPYTSLSNGVNSIGLKAEYFNNQIFEGQPLFTKTDSIISFAWGGGAPRKDMDGDDFGVRWTGELKPDQSGTYFLGVTTTCKVNLYINDSLVVNTPYSFRNEYSDPRLRKSGPMKFEAGKTYKIKIETSESYGDARIDLSWSEPYANHHENLRKQAVEVAKQADVIILCMGISPSLEGEEMNIAVKGFKGGDRTSLDLPDIQEQLIKEICALGKPVVLLLFSGSALSVNWEKDNIPAILETWYGGQAAGEAIADVLFGDYNPGGRLPVTFYKSVNDLPPFEDYNMKNRTYRYFTGEPLFSFGYGLSYTTFSYKNLNVKEQVYAGDTVKVSVDVKNTGKKAGDEVVELYISNLSADVPVPILALKAFKRIYLLRGETKAVAMAIPPDAFSIIDKNSKNVIKPGKFEIFVGGHQPDRKASKPESGILRKVITLF